jgi:serine/threonine protein kinase
MCPCVLLNFPLCEPQATGAEVAIKKMTLDSADEGCPATVLREISSLKHLSAHPNVVALFDVVLISPREISLVFEFCNTDLKGFMKLHDREQGSPALPPQLVRLLLFQTLRGMAFVHAKRYLHRDLKPQVRGRGTASALALALALTFGFEFGFNMSLKSMCSCFGSR